MRGLRLVWNPLTCSADLGFYNGALDTRFLLETMIIMSLFSDRRAEPSDVLPRGQSDPRGWWGDTSSVVPNWKLGSRLWLLQGARAIPSLPNTARGYILESTDWMLQDGVTSAIDARCWYDPKNRRQLDCWVRMWPPASPSAFTPLWREEFGVNENLQFTFQNIVPLAA